MSKVSCLWLANFGIIIGLHVITEVNLKVSLALNA
jgi:hypothetical protein